MKYLIIGASSGLGRELAYEYAKNKHDLVLISRDLRDLTAIKSDLEKKSEIKVEIIRESELNVKTSSTQRIIDVCKKVGGDTYVSGIGGKNYLDEKLFENNNLKLE